MTKSVQSINPFKSQLRQAGVIQTINDIVKAPGGELKVENPPAGRAGKEAARMTRSDAEILRSSLLYCLADLLLK